MMDFIKSAGLAPRLYHLIKQNGWEHGFTNDALSQFKLAYMSTLVRNRQIWSVWQAVASILNAHEIDLIALKGSALAFTVYPDEGIRPMGDLDLLVREGNGARARQLLLDAGAVARYVPQSQVHDQVHAHVSAITYKGVLVEIHQRLYAMGDPLNPPSEPLWAQCQSRMVAGSVMTVLDDAHMVYHIATHAWHGYRLGGMRLGWLLDIVAVMMRHVDELHVFNKHVEALNPVVAREVMQVLDWCMLLLPGSVMDIVPGVNFPSAQYFTDPAKIKEMHRLQTVRQILRTQGIGLKLKLIFREIIPENDYLVFRYGVGGVKGVLKRWLRR